jgi:N-acetylmuramoyl-L-alanine amidase
MKKIIDTKIHTMQNNILLNVLKNCKYTIFIICLCFLAKNSYGQEIVSKKLRKVVIDPGHGGKDPGAIGNFSKEKDIVLAVSLKLAELIREKHPDVKVIMTREDDRFIELYQRASIANKAKADLFISVHANSNKKKEPSGVEFYVLGLHKSEENLEVAKKENAVVNLEGNVTENYGFDPNSGEGNIIMTMKQSLFLDNSIHFAKKIENEFKNDDNQSIRGTKQAGFLVLYQTAMPSCLLEIGFISNAEEEEYMNSKLGQINIATKIANAFSEYKRKFEGKHTDISAPSKEPSAAEKKISMDKQMDLAEKLKTEKAGYPNAMKEMESNQKMTPSKNAAKQPPTAIEPIKEMTKVPSKPIAEDTISKEKEKTKTKPKESVLISPPRKIIIIEEETPLELVQISEPKIEASSKEMNTPTPKTKVDIASVAENTQKQKSNKEIISTEEKINIEPKKTESNTEKKVAKKINIGDKEIEQKVAINTPKNATNKELSKIATPPIIASKSSPIAPKTGLIFKIQVKASQRKIENKDIIYGTFPDIKESEEDGLYKYLTGEFKNIDEARKHKEYVKMKGFNDAFIVKYENGVRIK